MKLGLHLPINSVSFGQTSYVILRTLFEREKAGDTSIDWILFPIGPVDLSSQEPNKEFEAWVNNKIARAFETYNRDIPMFKLWHLNGSLELLSSKTTLLSFYELDSPTKIEILTAKNAKTCFTSEFTCNRFKDFGVRPHFLPLAFDSFNFKQLTERKYMQDDRIVFSLLGKFEHRKHTAKIIRAWMKKYANSRKHALHAAVYNPFLRQQGPQGPIDHNETFMRQVFEHGRPFNVTPFPIMNENKTYNEFLNSAHIVLGMSGGEGWGLPEFQSVAIGKHAVILDAHGYQTWANEKNATLVSPSGKLDAYDNIHFRKGEPYNQGQIFDWNEDEFIAACETAVKKAQSNKVNTEGLKLQEQFTKDKLVDGVINLLKNDA
jgi:hypothetical protein